MKFSVARNFETDPITNSSGNVVINHPSTITDAGLINSTNVNPSMVYGYNPITETGTNYGLADGVASLNPNPSEVYVDPDAVFNTTSWGGVISGYVVESI